MPNVDGLIDKYLSEASVKVRIPKDNAVQYNGFYIRKTTEGNYRVTFAYPDVYEPFTEKKIEDAKTRIDDLKKKGASKRPIS